MIGDVDKIKDLLEEGYDPNTKMTDAFDSVPLGWASTFGHIKSIIELIKYGADPLCGPNKAGNTPKTEAKLNGHPKVVKFFNK
jgi:ankyrin repeat protein